MEWLSERHLGEWRHAVDRFWQAEAPDWTEVGHVVATIAASAEEADLRHAATQAQPSIRNASASPQDRMTGVVARRRLGIVRDVLHDLAMPKFGRRGSAKMLTPEERHREKERVAPQGDHRGALHPVPSTSTTKGLVNA
jgi:hypothetical protein